MRYRGYVIVKNTGKARGHDIERDGVFVAWSAGSVADAKDTVDKMIEEGNGG